MLPMMIHLEIESSPYLITLHIMLDVLIIKHFHASQKL